MHTSFPRTAGTMVAAVALLLALSAGAEPVRVRHPEGIVHGFLALRTPDGTRIADGDLIQNVSGARVTSRLVFRFKDGSTHDEEAVFSQQQDFRLIRDHLVQKGPGILEGDAPACYPVGTATVSGRAVVAHRAGQPGVHSPVISIVPPASRT